MAGVDELDVNGRSLNRPVLRVECSKSGCVTGMLPQNPRARFGRTAEMCSEHFRRSNEDQLASIMFVGNLWFQTSRSKCWIPSPPNAMVRQEQNRRSECECGTSTRAT